MVFGSNLSIGSFPRLPSSPGSPGLGSGPTAQSQTSPPSPDEVCLGAGPEPLPSRPSASLLYIIDHFQAPGTLSLPGPFAVIEQAVQTGMTHGDSVVQAARSQGYSGPIKGVESSPPPSEDVPAYLKIWLSSDDPQMLSLCLTESMVSHRAETLSQMERNLQRILNEFPVNSVVNLSAGSGQSNLVQVSLAMMRGNDPENIEERKKVFDERRRVALALGLDAEKFCSDNREERDQIWPDVVQGLLDRAAATEQDARVKLAKAAYDQTVGTLTSWGNLVVVSAGNEQQLPGFLEEDFGDGRKFQFSPHFIGNDLVSSDTIAVGALHQGKVAEYSSRLPSVRIYASGDLGEDQGTSMAAPRVAAVLAGLKGAEPSLDASSAQQRLRQHYCIQQEVDSQPAYFLRP